MNDRPRPEEARAARWVRDLATPEADPVYRTRLREAFVSGRLAERAPAGPAVAFSPPRPWWRLSAARWAVAAAIVLVTALGVASLNRAPGWTLLAAEGVGLATVDGRPVTLDHAGELAARLRPGARVRVPEGATISIASAGLMALDLTGGSDVVIPDLPGRWFGRRTYAEVNFGTLRITTGRGFEGARMRVETPGAVVEVTGTTLAVICEPVGTCVCVLEGRVLVGRKGEPMADVEAGHRRFVLLDGRDEADVMREGEVMKLTMLRDSRREVMER